MNVWASRYARALSTLVVGMFFAAVAGAQSAAPVEPLRSGCEVDYPPFCIVDADGSATGFSVELLRVALAKMGRAVTFRTGPWNDVRGWLERGEIEALPLVGRTPEREELFDFTVPYLTMHGAIVVRTDTTDINILDDLKGRRVGVMKGDNAEEFLRREDREFEIVAMPTFTDAFHALNEGRFDAVVVQRLVAIRLLEQTGLGRLRIVDHPIPDFAQTFCFAVKEGDREMLALLNEGLALAMADGTHRQLYSKWFAALELPTDRPIVIGGDHNDPPFEFLDEKGRPAGYNVDLVRAVADATGLDIHIRLGEWTTTMGALERGEIDAIMGMLYSSERDETFDFSQAHLVNHCVAVTRKEDGPPPSSVADLSGKRIIVQAGDIMYGFCLQNGLTNGLTVVGSQEAALHELADGKHDCALVARMAAYYWIGRKGWDGLVVGRTSLVSPDYGFAVPKGQRALLAQLSEGLTAIAHSGEYRRIQEKWMGVYDDHTNWSLVLTYVAWVAGPLLLIVLLALLWSWGLRKQVARRTTELKEKEAFIRMVLDNLPVGVAVNSLEPAIAHYMNDLFPKIYRTTRDRLAGPDQFWEAVYPDPEVRKKLQARIEADCRSGDPERMVWTDIPIERTGELTTYITAQNKLIPGTQLMISSVWDVTEHKRAEGYREMGTEIIEILNEPLDIKEAISRVLTVLKTKTGFDAVGLRLQDGEDFPYFVQDGFPAEFMLTENTLVERGKDGGVCRGKDGNICLECTCGLVISGKTDPSNPLFTKGGSCWMNDSFPLLGLPSDQDPRLHPRNNCIHQGYASVALIPVRTKNRIVGLIQLNDKRKGRFTLETIEILEGIAAHIGSALMRKREEEETFKIQAQLNQAQKMESVGRLAGGVAHDFNNLLMGIMGYAELCKHEVGENAQVREWLDEITRESERSANLTRQLLAFARRQTVAPQVVDLNDAVVNMLKMLRRLIGENVNLAWQPGAEPWSVKIDPGQVDQILVNLCVNARDAIGGAGRISIETENVSIDADYCAEHIEAAPGPYVMLAVSDDGCGMDHEMLGKVFEPFFTTKPTGDGTGLGLATIYGIVKQNNGFVNVYSEPGKGSTFRIYLPRDTSVSKAAPQAAKKREIQGGTETILLVEDEKAIRVTLRLFLERFGYTVIEAGSPDEALRLVAGQRDHIDLLITDVIMPGMSGRDLAGKLAVDYPSMKILYMSGYTADVIANRGILEDGVQFIGKPISRDALAQKVREVLG